MLPMYDDEVVSAFAMAVIRTGGNSDYQAGLLDGLVLARDYPEWSAKLLAVHIRWSEKEGEISYDPQVIEALANSVAF